MCTTSWPRAAVSPVTPLRCRACGSWARARPWVPRPRTRWISRAAAARTTSTWTGCASGWRPTSNSRRPRSDAGEVRRALFGEGPDPFREVARFAHLLLDLGLELELLAHALVEPVVELPLDARVGPGGAVGQLGHEPGGALLKLIVRPDLVDQAPFQGQAGVDPLPQHRHLGRPSEPDPRGHQHRRSAVRD